MDDVQAEMSRLLLPLNVDFLEFGIMRQLENQTEPRQVVAVDVYELNLGRSSDEHCEDYLKAVDRCVAKGWLHQVTPAEERRGRARRKKETIPACDDNTIPVAFHIDFTDKGYGVYKAARTILSGEAIRGERFLLEANVLEIYSTDLPTCISRRDFVLRQSPTPNTEDDGRTWFIQKVDSISEPQKVGRWRLNRHEVLESGFCITIRYRREPTVEWPESGRKE